MNKEQLLEHDLVEYTAKYKNGAEVLVTNDVEALIKLIEENGLGSTVFTVVAEDSVNICPVCGLLHNLDDIVQLSNDIICKDCLDKKLKITFRMADTYEPFELLRLSKDAFYDKISEELSDLNDHIGVEVQDANLEFVVETVEYNDYVYIQVEVLEYTIQE